MKRGGPIQRRTPLSRVGSRLAQVSAKRAAKAPAYRHFKARLHARAGGQCEYPGCTLWAPDTAPWCHHRRTQGQGGEDSLWNCVWLCLRHHEQVQTGGREAYRTGWLIPNGARPEEWPVYRSQYGIPGWWLPTPEGWVAAAPHDRQRAA